MDFENVDYDSVSVKFDFRGDAAPTAMNPHLDDVISDHQQSILNDLRINLCHENFIYLNNHKEVSIDPIICSISTHLYVLIGLVFIFNNTYIDLVTVHFSNKVL